MKKIDVLKRVTPERVDLIKMLEECSEEERCNSTICPVCMRHFRRAYASQQFAEHGAARPLWFITYIHDDYAVWNIEEAYALAAKLKKQFLRQVQRKLPPGSLVTGYVEIEYRWQIRRYAPHIHAVASGCTYKEVRRIRPKSDMEDRAYRPLEVTEIEPGRELKAMTYLCKQYPPGYQAQKQRRSLPPDRERAKEIREKRQAARMAILAQFSQSDLTVLSGASVKNGKRLMRVRRKK